MEKDISSLDDIRETPHRDIFGMGRGSGDDAGTAGTHEFQEVTCSA